MSEGGEDGDGVTNVPDVGIDVGIIGRRLKFQVAIGNGEFSCSISIVYRREGISDAHSK